MSRYIVVSAFMGISLAAFFSDEPEAAIYLILVAILVLEL